HQFRYDVALDFVAAASDRTEAGVTEQALHVMLHGIACASHHLHADVRTFEIVVGSDNLGNGRLHAGVPASVEHLGGAIGQQACNLRLDAHVCELVGYDLELGDRTAELRALRGVVLSNVDGLLGISRSAGCDRHAL